MVSLQNWLIGCSIYLGYQHSHPPSMTSCGQTVHGVDLLCGQATLLSDMSASREGRRPQSQLWPKDASAVHRALFLSSALPLALV